MADSVNKKEREKKRRKNKENKAEKRAQKKASEKKGNQIMYLDEFGNFTDTPPDPKQRTKIRKEEIMISIPKKEDFDAMEFVRNGRVKFFNTEKGYGFIIDDETGESLFAHVNNLNDEIKENDRVTFEMGSGPKGPVALNVSLVPAAPAKGE